MEKSKTCDRDLVASPYRARPVARQGPLCIAVMLTMALLTSCTFWRSLSGNTAEPMVIVVSHDTPAFSQVAREITYRYPVHAEVWRVGDSDAARAGTLRRLQESEVRLVVAIGLPAALAASSCGKC